MGIFSRFKDIVNANINSILDKAEDPEKMIRLMIREMEDTLVDLKSSTAGKMADTARLKRKLSESQAEVTRMEGLAETALTKDREDLAREALMHKKTAQNQVEVMESELSHLEEVVEDSKNNITQLETKLEEVRQKHRMLILRSKQAAEKKRANQSANEAKGQNALRRFEEFETKIERMEAEAELSGITANSNLEQQIKDLEDQSELDDELEALKQRISKK